MNIVMYTKPECKFCDRAKATLTNMGWAWEEKEVGVDISSDAYKKEFRSTVPCIIINGENIGGYVELGNYIAEKIS